MPFGDAGFLHFGYAAPADANRVGFVPQGIVELREALVGGDDLRGHR